MKDSAILSLVLAIAVGIAGCGQRKEVAVTEADDDKAVEQEPEREDRPRREEQPMYGDHKHAFADPAERAKKWNDPERDGWQHPEEIVAALDLKPGATVADIGAGTGYMVAHLSKAVGKGGTVIAIDASAEMVEYLAKRGADLGPARIVPRKVGADDPELQAAGVDGVLALDTWHHVKGREAYARKVYEGLKRGGRFVVVDYDVDAEVGPPKAMRLEPARVTKQLEAGASGSRSCASRCHGTTWSWVTRIRCCSGDDRRVRRACSRTPGGRGGPSGSGWRTRPPPRPGRSPLRPARVPPPARPGGGRRTGEGSGRWPT